MKLVASLRQDHQVGSRSDYFVDVPLRHFQPAFSQRADLPGQDLYFDGGLLLPEFLEFQTTGEQRYPGVLDLLRHALMPQSPLERDPTEELGLVTRLSNHLQDTYVTDV